MRGQRRREERIGVQVNRVVEDAFGIAHLLHYAEIHNCHAVTHVAHCREVVRDHDVCQPVLLLKVNEQVHYLCANGHVKRGNRLVERDDLRVQREGARNADSLALATAELVREQRCLICRQSYLFQQFLNAGGNLPLGHRRVDLERLSNDATDAHAGIKRRPWVLEHSLQRTAQFALARAAESRHVLTFEEDLTGCGLLEAKHDLQRGRLAAAGLAHKAHSLAALDVEADVVHSLQDALVAAEEGVAHREPLAKVSHGYDGVGVAVHAGGRFNAEAVHCPVGRSAISCHFLTPALFSLLCLGCS